MFLNDVFWTFVGVYLRYPVRKNLGAHNGSGDPGEMVQYYNEARIALQSIYHEKVTRYETR
jgi:hypothetical protein